MNFKASYKWLNDYYDGKLPKLEDFSRILTMNSSEVDGVEENGDDYLLDIKVLPSLAHSCLCHRGIAREFGALSGNKPKKYSRDLSEFKISKTSKELSIKISDEKLCRRYIGRLVENIKIGPSPLWLKEKMESVGQRSINNVVDATNFVMLEIGQPMHAFDADKLKSLSIDIKKAIKGDYLKTLDGKDVELDTDTLLITSDNVPLAIAGIKGGVYAEVDGNTKNIILESANFEPVNIRKTSQRINIKTDASKRYENEITPELTYEAMDVLTKVINEVANTSDIKIGEMVDVYPRKANKYKVGISTSEAISVIGISFKDKDLENVFERINFQYEKVLPIDKVVEEAKKLIGVPYKLGASVSYDAPRFFDCSSFTSYVYTLAGVQIPRISIDQYVWSKKISEKDIKAGDLIFINTREGKIRYESVEFVSGTKVEQGIDHTVLYIGDGKIIHASSKKGAVSEDSLESFKDYIVGFGRIVENDERYVVTVPDERLDIRIKEDLAEEIGRIYGYDKLKDIELPKTDVPLKINKSFYYSNKVREIMGDLGFSEVNTYTFVDKGDLELENPMSPDKKYLRKNLTDSIKNALELNARYSELIEMPQIKIFELSHVFDKTGEHSRFVIGVKTPLGVKGMEKETQVLKNVLEKLKEELNFEFKKINKDENIFEFDFTEIIKDLPEPIFYDYNIPLADNDLRFKKISNYPFMIRDVAVFVPEGTEQKEVFDLILKEAGSLVVKSRIFDVFTKKFPDGGSKTSYAFRLVFQSFDKTLSDIEMNEIMDRVTKKLNSNEGWQVR
jgi:phenylalanyl-tRNA synthetase beta subunit